MRNELVFAGVNLRAYGVDQVDSIDAWRKPLRKVTKIAVPGRNGDLIVDGDSYENVVVPYKCTMPSRAKENYLELLAYLGSFGGYERMEFSGDPNYFRLARLQTDVSPDFKAFLRFGSFVLSFDCKPQRFMKSGEIWTSISADTSLRNPTSQKARPIIRIYGTGTVQIGSKTITVNTAGTSYIDFDCDTMDAYEGAYNRNSNISIDFEDLFLAPGNNGIALDGPTIKIQPRWWEI